MHRALQIQEILSIIFGHAYDDELPRRINRRKALGTTLARLARTCKCFSDPALNILWYTQHSLLELLKCFPVRVVDVKGNDVTFKMIPKVEDYERVFFYAPRIKELGKSSPWARFSFQTSNIPILVSSVLLSQRLSWNMGPLLPNLRYLQIYLANFTGQAAYARLVMGPKLSTVILHPSDFEGEEYDEEHDPEDPSVIWSNVVAVVSPYASKWQQFEFASTEWESTHESLSAMVLCLSFSNLDTLRIANLVITRDILCHIATMPKLRDLKFRISSEELVAFTETPPSPKEFGSIISLGVFTANLPPCTALLSRPPFRRLQQLSVQQSVEGGIWTLEPFIMNLNTPDLNLLSLCTLYDMEVELEPTPFTRGMLSTLLSFPSMRQLKVTFDLLVSLDDSDLKAISSAWPLLEELSLPDHSLQSTPNLTITGLLGLIKECKDLKNLRLRVDATKLPKFSDNASVFQSQITVLNFYTSPLPQSLSGDMVELLALFFPKLYSLHVSDMYASLSQDPPLTHGEREHARAWKSVIQSFGSVIPYHTHFCFD